MSVLQPAKVGVIDPGRSSLIRPAGLALLAGAAGVVAVSVLYGLSPPHAAMPMVPLDLEAALAGAQAGRATMRGAGLASVPADGVIAASCMLLGVLDAARGRGLGAMGWFLIAASGILFAVIDVLVRFVLPPLATAGAQGFLAAKLLFDALFLVGTATFGLGAMAAMLPHVSGAGEIPRLLAVAALLAGLIALAAAMAGLLGLSVNPHVLGVGILGGSVLFALIGIGLAVGGGGAKPWPSAASDSAAPRPGA